jgi:hypothetical protein
MRMLRDFGHVVRMFLYKSPARRPVGQLRGLVARRATPSVRRALWRYKSLHRRQVGDLRGYEWRRYSQDGEDGIFVELLCRVGASSRFFVEFGVESGAQCNCARLVWEDDGGGLFIEGDAAMAQALAARYRNMPRVRSAQDWTVRCCITTARRDTPGG